MKKTLILLFFLLVVYPFDILSQSFVVTPDGLANSENTDVDYFNLKYIGSNSQNLYETSMLFINKTLRNPSISIKSDIPNKYIRYSIYEPDFIVYSNSGSKRQIEASFDVELQFSDESVIYRVLNIDMSDKNSKYKLHFSGSKWGSYIIYTDKGKLFKENEKSYIENYFNSQLKNYDIYVSNNRSKNDQPKNSVSTNPYKIGDDGLITITNKNVSSYNNPIEEFGGLKFGYSKAEVVNALKDKMDVSDLIRRQDDDKILLGKTKFGGYDFDKLFLMFNHNRLYAAVYKQEIISTEYTAAVFLDIKNKLNEKYGEGIVKSTTFIYWKDEKSNSIILDVDTSDNSLSLTYSSDSIQYSSSDNGKSDF